MQHEAALDNPRLAQRDALIAGAIFLIAFVLRLVFLLNSPDKGWPHSLLYEGDAVTWVRWAQAIDQGAPFEFNLPLRSPAVAYSLGWLVPGELHPPFTWIKVIWCCMTSLACALTYLAGTLAFNRRVGVIAAALTVLSFSTSVLSTSLNNEAIYQLLLMAIVLLSLMLLNRATVLVAALIAVLHGVAMLTRAEHMLLLGFMLMLLMWRMMRADLPERNRRAVIAMILLIGPIVICLPWSIYGSRTVHRYNTENAPAINFDASPLPWSESARSYLQSLPAFTQQGSFGAATYFNQVRGVDAIDRAHVEQFFNELYGYIPEPISRFTFVSMKGPLDFALANHPQSDGGFTKAALASPNEPNPSLQPARPDHLRLINHGYSIGWLWISHDYSAWVQLVQSKLARFISGMTQGFTSRNLPLGLDGQRHAVDAFTAPRAGSASTSDLLWRWTLIALMGTGAAICATRRNGSIWLAIIAYKLIVTVLFYGYARQAMSILPVLFVFIAVAVDQVALCTQPLWRPWRVPLIIAAAALAVALIVFDITGSLNRPYLAITGPVDLAPQWGQDAFESNQMLLMSPAPPPVSP